MINYLFIDTDNYVNLSQQQHELSIIDTKTNLLVIDNVHDGTVITQPYQYQIIIEEILDKI
ncbi:MAG: hypothetical protein KatS3mg083_096 [Candidatus Dojkabacteria bacterium]|nr:MAG: hypothetical protein KatS3mg083_096 [Candidatus Dojkabacteria bacterium]